MATLVSRTSQGPAQPIIWVFSGLPVVNSDFVPMIGDRVRVQGGQEYFVGANHTLIQVSDILATHSVSSPLLNGAFATSNMWINGSATSYTIVGVEAIFTTAGGASAAVTLTVDTGTQAPGAGTAQLTATIPLTGTANTALAGTIITTPTTIATGSRVSYVGSGTLTGLANLIITVHLQPVLSF